MASFIIANKSDFVIPANFVDTGYSYVDSSFKTNSNIIKPSVTFSLHLCGDQQFKRFSINTSIHIIKECSQVLAGGLSIKGFVPYNANMDEVESMIDLLSPYLSAQLS